MLKLRLIGVLSLVGMVVGCASNSKSMEDNGRLIHERNQGYGILYGLMTDERKVDGLLVIKHADEPLGSTVKEIAAASRAAKDKLDSFKTAQSRIVFDEPDLPKVEQESRDLESKRDAKKLSRSVDGDVGCEGIERLQFTVDATGELKTFPGVKGGLNSCRILNSVIEIALRQRLDLFFTKHGIADGRANQR
jgi:hypothetical protein